MMSMTSRKTARALRQVAVCSLAASNFAIALGFAYMFMFARTLDSSSKVVIAKMHVSDYLLSLLEWLPALLLNGLIAGAVVFWIVRRNPSVRRWSIVAGSCVSAALLSLVVLGHRFVPWTWLDYSTAAVGLVASGYLLFSCSTKEPQAIGMLVSAGLGLLCIAGETGAENARWTSLTAAITELDSTAVPACRERDLHRGQAVIIADAQRGKQRYRFAPSENDLPYCNPKS
ncbi:hypothetical protein [Bradyrhizobium sp. USDA 3364]